MAKRREMAGETYKFRPPPYVQRDVKRGSSLTPPRVSVYLKLVKWWYLTTFSHCLLHCTCQRIGTFTLFTLTFALGFFTIILVVIHMAHSRIDITAVNNILPLDTNTGFGMTDCPQPMLEYLRMMDNPKCRKNTIRFERFAQ